MTFAQMKYANVKHNPNYNHNPYPTLPSLSLLLEISTKEQLSPEQMSDHRHSFTLGINTGVPNFR